MTEAFSRAILQDTDELAQEFYQWGHEGLPLWAIANRLNVHVNTLGAFLRRAVKCRAAHMAGKADGRAGRLSGDGGPERVEAVWRAGMRPAAPGLGQKCPTCGQTFQGDGAIVLTPETIAEAQRKIGEIIERYHPGARAEGQAYFDNSRNSD